MNIFDLLVNDLLACPGDVLINRYCDPNYMIEYLENFFVKNEENIISCNINSDDEHELFLLRKRIQSLTHDVSNKNRETFHAYLKLPEEQKLFYFSFKAFDVILNKHLARTMQIGQPFRIFYRKTVNQECKILSNCLIKEFVSKKPNQNYIQKLLILLQFYTPKIFQDNKKRFNELVNVGKMNTAKQKIEKGIRDDLAKFITKDENKNKPSRELLKSYIHKEFQKYKAYHRKMINDDISYEKFKKLVPSHFWVKKRQDLDKKSSLLDSTFTKYWEKYGQLHQNSYIRTIYNKIIVLIESQSQG